MVSIKVSSRPARRPLMETWELRVLHVGCYSYVMWDEPTEATRSLHRWR